jgi:hypothetical protein
MIVPIIEIKIITCNIGDLPDRTTEAYLAEVVDI